MLGNQFYFVALTWLLLELTDSGALLGSVLMVAAIPRLIFMLVGGAVVDRFSPRPVLRVFSLAVTIIVGTLTLLLWREALSIGWLYVIAALIGVSDAFFYPAAMSSVPKMIDKAQSPAANALVQTGDQITQIAGPALAGVLIGLVGLPLTFAINTALFAFGAILLWLLRARSLSAATAAHSGNMLGSILEGLRYAWRDPAIRASLIIIGMLNFALVGPLTVGTAALTETYFGGAGAYGLLMAAMGIGSLAGTLGRGCAARRPPPRPHPGRSGSAARCLRGTAGLCASAAGGVDHHGGDGAWHRFHQRHRHSVAAEPRGRADAGPPDERADVQCRRVRSVLARTGGHHARCEPDGDVCGGGRFDDRDRAGDVEQQGDPRRDGSHRRAGSLQRPDRTAARMR